MGWVEVSDALPSETEYVGRLSFFGDLTNWITVNLSVSVESPEL